MALLLGIILAATARPAMWSTPVPQDQRGREDAERAGQHDANNMRTIFWNYGMVGDYPRDPGNVDLSVFHSVEVPKGSGMNYSDGVTPFVLAKINQVDGSEAFIMETGFRERQGTSPYFNRVMRFEPRPGYFQSDSALNPGRSPALSNDPRTWPDFWPDRLDDFDDPGWNGSWNGYFGKQIVADQESYMVLDDDYYDAWNFYPDSRDSTRRGLGLRIEVRGFQWANPQARNVIFWHYDITNEGTTDYDDNIIFGLYMDSGVGGSAFSCDQIYESDDDNAFFAREFNDQIINLVYTWDNRGHGRDLSGCGRTGYLGYAYMETPGNPTDGLDNDEDGITDERRDGGPGTFLVGEEAIIAHVQANYNVTRFETTFGPLADMPAVRAGLWWTGDEDMDWTVDNHDLGADGLPDTGDTGEGDGIPTAGEPNFDDTDLNESDQIGLTGFKLNRIRPGYGNPDQETDGIVFFTGNEDWPERLYNQFSDPDPDVRFDEALAGQLQHRLPVRLGPLPAGRRPDRAVQPGSGLRVRSDRAGAQHPDGAADLQRQLPLRRAAQDADGDRRAGRRLRAPVLGRCGRARGRPGDRRVRFRGVPHLPVHRSGFPGSAGDLHRYRQRAPGQRAAHRPVRSDRRAQRFFRPGHRGRGLLPGHGFGPDPYLDRQHGRPTASSTTTRSRPTTSAPRNSASIPRRTPSRRRGHPAAAWCCPPMWSRSGPIPGCRATCRASADTETVAVAGRGMGTVAVEVVNSTIVPDDHQFRISFTTPSPDSLRARAYTLTDVTADEMLFETGDDFLGMGIGPVGAGLLPIVNTATQVEIDAEENTGFESGSPTDAQAHRGLRAQRAAHQPGAARASPTTSPSSSTTTVMDTSVADGFTWPADAGQVRDHCPDGRWRAAAGLPLPRS